MKDLNTNMNSHPQLKNLIESFVLFLFSFERKQQIESYIYGKKVHK